MYYVTYNVDNQTGWSALMAAVYKSHKDVALRLIEAGATPHIQDAVSWLNLSYTNLSLYVILSHACIEQHQCSPASHCQRGTRKSC